MRAVCSLELSDLKSAQILNAGVVAYVSLAVFDVLNKSAISKFVNVSYTPVLYRAKDSRLLLG